MTFREALETNCAGEVLVAGRDKTNSNCREPTVVIGLSTLGLRLKKLWRAFSPLLPWLHCLLSVPWVLRTRPKQSVPRRAGMGGLCWSRDLERKGGTRCSEHSRCSCFLIM